MRPALLIIDMIEEFVHGRLKSPSAESIIPAIRTLIDNARKHGIPVIYLIDSHLPFDRELSIWGPHALVHGEESEIVEELQPGEKDLVFRKRSYSGFRETGLASVLRDLGVDTVVLTGIHTHICVLHTAIDAYYERFNIIVVSDAVAAFSESDHAYALDYMRKVLGAKVLTSSEVAEAFAGGYK
uniref:Cysteine hydrolase n=1 Tax=Thermosphaera aggregans TaxID=54254 RepID=A0A7C2FZZ6_9CREN